MDFECLCPYLWRKNVLQKLKEKKLFKEYADINNACSLKFEICKEELSDLVYGHANQKLFPKKNLWVCLRSGTRKIK